MKYIEPGFRKKVAQLTVLFWMIFRMLSFEVGIEKFCRHVFLKKQSGCKSLMSQIELDISNLCVYSDDSSRPVYRVSKM